MIVSKTNVTPKTKNTIDNNQETLENLILLYQKAFQIKSYSIADDYFKSICEEYRPKAYIHKWYSKYGHLYDSPDDFEQEYMSAFISAVRKWKPRELRRKSKHDGKGYFMNYFWACLRYKFINEVKAEATCKMNTAKQCPLCCDWYSPLSTHLIKNHPELLWDHIAESGLNINTLKSCPYCSTFKVNKLSSCEHSAPGCKECNTKNHNLLLRKHLLSNHSNLLFERFHALYPETITLSSKPVSVNIYDEDEGDSTIYDFMPSHDTISSLIDNGVTGTQMSIISRIIDHGVIELRYDPKLYNCSESEFQAELEDLRTKLVVCGIMD